jgi:hypothetical protein
VRVSSLYRADGLVDTAFRAGEPFAMPVMPHDRDGRPLGVAELGPQRAAALIKASLDPQTGASGRRVDQLDNDLIADQRPAAPVRRDRTEQPMLNLVPPAGPRREVADRDRQGHLGREPDELDLPRPDG